MPPRKRLTPADFTGTDAPSVFWRMVYTSALADRIALAHDFLQIRQNEEDSNWIGAGGADAGESEKEKARHRAGGQTQAEQPGAQ